MRSARFHGTLSSIYENRLSKQISNFWIRFQEKKNVHFKVFLRVFKAKAYFKCYSDFVINLLMTAGPQNVIFDNF